MTAMMTLCVRHGDAMRNGTRLLIHDNLALKWRMFQISRAERTQSLVLRNVRGLRLLVSWTNIECELEFGDLFELCSEANGGFDTIIAWLTTIAWQIHRASPMSHPQNDLLERVDVAAHELAQRRETRATRRSHIQQ